MAERVELELLCLPGGDVGVALHLRVAGTPVRSFASPLHAQQHSPSAAPASLDASAAGAAAAAIAAEALEALAAAPAGGGTGGPTSPQQAVACSSSPQPAADVEQVATATAAPEPQAEQHEAGPPTSPLPAELQTAATQPASSNGQASTQQQQGQQATNGAGTAPAAAAAATTAAATTAAAPAEAAGEAGGGGGLDAVMGMLQQLLASTGAQQQRQRQRQQQQQPQPAAEPAPSPHSSGGGGSSGGTSSALPSGSVEKLLALELEVVQLQQSLQIAQLEFETRTVQLHSLKQRADEADQRAQAAEERATGLAQQVQQLERQAGDLRCQLGEAAAKHVQELTLQVARLSAAAAKQQAAEEEAARLRQQLGAAQEALKCEQALRGAAAAAERGPLQERAAALQHENQQLRAHVASACGALKALGIPAHQVFSRAALALVGHAAPAQSPPLSPAGGAAVQHAGRAQHVQQQHAQAAEPALPDQQTQQPEQVQQPAQRAAAPPVPRLQLSSISLEALQAAASQQQKVEEAAVAAAAARLPPLPPPSLQQEGGRGGAEAGTPQGGARAAAYARLRVSVGSPASALGHIASPHSVQNSTGMPLPPLSARLPMSPAQQQLLATARQWQLSARSAVGDEEAEERIAAYRPQQAQQQQGAAPAGGRAPARAAFGGGPGAKAALARAVQTARPHRAGHGGAAPGRSPAKQPRRTYGQEPGFIELKQAYQAVVSAEADSAAKWARSVFSSSSAVETDPRRVEPVVQGLLQLFRESGLSIPLQKCGPCQYKLGASKLAVRLVNGRLMGRAGAGLQVDFFDWLAKQPAAQG